MKAIVVREYGGRPIVLEDQQALELAASGKVRCMIDRTLPCAKPASRTKSLEKRSAR